PPPPASHRRGPPRNPLPPLTPARLGRRPPCGFAPPRRRSNRRKSAALPSTSTDSPRGARRRASAAAARLVLPVHRLAARRASPSLRGRRSARTTRSQTRRAARVAEPPRPPLGSYYPFTDSPRGARRRASAAAARLVLPLTQVSLAGVGEHGHHELFGVELRSDGARAERGGARGDAHEQALLARAPSPPRHPVLVADHDDPVDHAPVQDTGHEGRADPLDRMGPRPA